ncbi:PREDICTED: pleiotropic drug resistance protein 1-like isoform X1 [Prunus mume]|uniref:Pleiotropic drug resistance protein 1-like isoform X1 n=1 Tax=Prunus mume TaxID=102107 RepID=A0ABM0P7U1_PRUMU|nr:PREDICTED: pleiotropic drug resistance protein 1-like isoform X1 [Prunus mume]
MTLLLGPPSSGKTTLLLALARELDQDLKRSAVYISQHDVHMGEMTVGETLAFSARCQGIGTRYDILAEISRREKEANIKPDADLDIYMKAVASEVQVKNKQCQEGT